MVDDRFAFGKQINGKTTGLLTLQSSVYSQGFPFRWPRSWPGPILLYAEHRSHLADFESQTTGLKKKKKKKNQLIQHFLLKAALLRYSKAVFVTFLIVVTKISDKSNKSEGLFWLTLGGYRLLWWGRHGNRNTRQLVMLQPQSGSRQRQGAQLQLLFLQSWTPACRLPLTLRVGLIFPLQLALSGNTLTDYHRCLPQPFEA